MCFTCFLGFFGSAGASFSLPFSVDDFLDVSFGFSVVASAGFSVAFAGFSVVFAGFSTGSAEPSVVSSYNTVLYIILCVLW